MLSSSAVVFLDLEHPSGRVVSFTFAVVVAELLHVAGGSFLFGRHGSCVVVGVGYGDTLVDRCTWQNCEQFDSCK